EINRLMNQPLITSPLRGDERIINFIKGLNYIDERIAKVSAPFNTVGEIALVGADALCKQLIAQKVAASMDINLVNLPVELLPSQPSDLEEFARLWQRETSLLPIAAYIDTQQ